MLHLDTVSYSSLLIPFVKSAIPFRHPRLKIISFHSLEHFLMLTGLHLDLLLQDYTQLSTLVSIPLLRISFVSGLLNYVKMIPRWFAGRLQPTLGYLFELHFTKS